MTAPIRLQLSRQRGFSLQRLSLTANGLPAINVARPGRWGNPFAIGDSRKDDDGNWEKVGDGPTAVRFFIDMLARDRRNYPSDTEIATLAGSNLACWCKPGRACHADVLLALANHKCSEVVA